MTFDQLMADDLNYALEANSYLEEIKRETDKEKRFKLLKKYFTEKITRNLYQNMDLLYATDTDFEKFKSMYLMVAKDLFLNVLLAADTLISERGVYELDPTSMNGMCDSLFGHILLDGTDSVATDSDEYSIVSSSS